MEGAAGAAPDFAAAGAAALFWPGRAIDLLEAAPGAAGAVVCLALGAAGAAFLLATTGAVVDPFNLSRRDTQSAFRPTF